MSALPTIHDVTIGRTVSLDPQVWQRHGSETWFGLDHAELTITAQGIIRTDDGSHVHRFYTDDEIMLQAFSRSPDGHDADDFTLFHSLSASYPPDQWSRQAFIERISRAWFEHDGTQYRRFWFDGNDLAQPPVLLHEAVYEAFSGPTRHVAQTCMLYSRPLTAGGAELLLAIETGGDHNPVAQELMVGLPLSPAQFNA